MKIQTKTIGGNPVYVETKFDIGEVINGFKVIEISFNNGVCYKLENGSIIFEV